MSTTRDAIEIMLSVLEKMRDEDARTDKLTAEQWKALAEDRAVKLANVLALLRRIPAANGTVADDVRRQRDLIEKHLRSTAA
jgi:hypothetical protein